MKEFFELLRKFCDRGIPMMGEHSSGASIASGNNYEKAWTTDTLDIKALLLGYGNLFDHAKGVEIRRFRFIPKQAGYLVIDIDRHEKQMDGLKVFNHLLSQNHINEPMLKDIENGSFPCYVTTPNNGFHLYFRYSGCENFPRKLTYSVEVFYSDKSFITVPYSFGFGRNGPAYYKLYGNLDDAPPLFPSLQNLLVSKMPKYHEPRSLVERKYSLRKIAEFVELDQRWSGRNDKSFLIACRAVKEGYTKEEALQFLRSYSGLDGLPDSEILSTVKSAYKEHSNELY